AFYIFRLFFLTFHGESRVEEAVEEHVHESPTVMIGPLGILAIFSTIAGFFGLPFWERFNGIERFLAPVFHDAAPLLEKAESHAWGEELVLMLLSLVVGLLGIGLAYRMYVQKPALAQQTRERFPELYTLLLNKYYVDELYDRWIVQPCLRLATWFWERCDVRRIDGLVNGVGEMVRWDGLKVSRLQTGFVRNYALSLFLGVVFVITVLLFSYR
ncbi:MAG: NADH-quinone oxidoreductase subunit L, partial [Nitrospinota bacterium]